MICKYKKSLTYKKIIWVTSERFEESRKPSFWFIYNLQLYYGICEYNLDLFEDVSDFIVNGGSYFNPWKPTILEFDHLISLNPTFYKLDYKRAILNASEEELDHWCEYELDFCKIWHRDNLLNNLLK